MQTLFESELKVMEILWEHQPVTAKQVSVIAAETVGWNKNTTYTMLKKLEAKGLLTRADPGFVCTATVSRDEIQKEEARSLVGRLFGGSRQALFSALLSDETLSAEEYEELRRLIETR